MDKNFPLREMGNKIHNIRKNNKMSQVSFYRMLYPELELEEENIKKKMYAIENGELKRVNLDLLLRIHEKLGVSIDYLLGYETEFKNYENKAVSEYTGLSSEAIDQLHFWRKYRDKEIPEPSPSMTKEQFRHYANEKNNKQDSNWILYIISKLLEMKTDEERKRGLADLSIFYDVYMMSLDPPETILGIPEEIAYQNIPFIEKVWNSVRIASDSISYKDRNNEIHSINVGVINQQVWKERLLHDVEKFISGLKKQDEKTP